MRVIAGTARGRRLRVARVPGLRPTGARARETLFGVVGDRLPGARVLDVFAGTGALGIEALSRGAAAATFLERHPRALRVLGENLDACGLRGRARLLGGHWRAALRRLAREAARFELVLMDPPYRWADPGACLEELGRCRLLAAEGLVVLEHAARREPGPAPGWQRRRLLRVGDTAFSLYVPEGGDPTTAGGEAAPRPRR